MAEDGGGGYLRGMVTGLLFGAAAALLMAPKRGEELRGELADNAYKLKDKAGDMGTTVAGTARDLKARGEELVSNVRSRGGDVAEDMSDKLNRAQQAATSPGESD